MSSLQNYLSKYTIGTKSRKKRKRIDDVKEDVDEYIDADADIDDLIDKSSVTRPKGSWKSVETKETVAVLPKLKGDGSYAGFQTKDQSERSNEAEVKTIYRDLSGQKIDSRDEKLQSNKKDKPTEKAERKEQLQNVNRSEADVVRKLQELARLKKVKHEGLNLYENNSELNKKKKKDVKQEDPALLFDKTIKNDYNKTRSARFVSITGRKLYKEGFPQNRFDIKPGWRWDGVDRSNGLENRWFKRQAEIHESKVSHFTTAEDV
ncbi:hypothetical protein FOA43_002281 [Brettanomyces nanus]|uniref:Pre-mRNA-splicing factor CWC26 n=1 Tax=Eeniella nana TaxID=13502 RepID=A0A875S1Z6_EENNA|nr:uncharacterized protein FOA43_002281 [Brettanomyces nanus]QPG74943.1 hypothetical protein FOA43_002281 [Brettanomyces nanus]